MNLPEDVSNSNRKRAHDLAMALVLLASFLLNLRNLGHPDLKPLDEVFHAIVARNFLKHPLTPTLVDQPYLAYDYGNWQANHIWLHKPPMGLWQIALSFAILGVKPFALRLPSAILAPAAAGLTYLIGRLWLDRMAALIAALLQAFNPVIGMLVHGFVFSDHVDVALLFWTECAIWLLARAMRSGRRIDIILAGVAQGLAFLSKSYPALLVLVMAIFAWLFLKSLSGQNLWWFIGTAIATVLPWTLWTAIRFPDEFIYENLGILRHLNQNVEGWQAPWDRVIFGYFISIFHIYYPAALAAVALAIHGAIRMRKPGLRMVLAWLVIVLVPNLLATSKPMTATLIGWPAMWLILGWSVSRSVNGDRWAAGALLAALAAMIFVPARLIPTQGWGPGAGGSFGSVMRDNPWVAWITLGALCIGAITWKIQSAHRAVVPALLIAGIFLAVRWWKSDHPRGYFYVAWEVTRSEGHPRDFSAMGAFAGRLPVNAAFIVEEEKGHPLDNKQLEFFADRSCYRAGQDAHEQMAELMRAGALPYLVSAEPHPNMTDVFDDAPFGMSIYAGDPDARIAAERSASNGALR